MKKLLIAGLASVIGLSAANAANISLTDPYIGVDFGLGVPSWYKITGDALDYVPGSNFLIGGEIGTKFLPATRFYNVGVNFNYNYGMPSAGEKKGPFGKVNYGFSTFGIDVDNYLGIANKASKDHRTDLVLGAGMDIINAICSGGGCNDTSSTMALDFKFGVDQGISDDMKLSAKIHFYLPMDSEDVGIDAYTKLSIGIKMLF